MKKEDIEKGSEKLMEEAGEEIQEKEDKKDTKRMLIMVAAIIGIFLIVFFSFKIFYSKDEIVTIDDLHKKNIEGELSDNNYIYNGYSFVYADGLWYTQVQRKDKLWDIPLHFGPRDLENITFFGYINKTFDEADMYITFDPTGENLKFEALGSAELSLNMVKGLGVVPIASCDRNESEDEIKQIEIDKACKGRPIVTCDDTDKAVVYLKQKEPAQIEMKGNCVVIQGKEWDLIKSIDKFILIWYGIIKP